MNFYMIDHFTRVLKWNCSELNADSGNANSNEQTLFPLFLNDTSLTLSENVFNVKNEPIHGPVQKDMMQF